MELELGTCATDSTGTGTDESETSRLLSTGSTDSTAGLLPRPSDHLMSVQRVQRCTAGLSKVLPGGQ
jgi:hypothetical protein